MARTYKDQPYYIRKAREYKVRLKNDEYHTLARHGGEGRIRYKKGVGIVENMSYGEWLDYHDEIFDGDFKHDRWSSWPVPSWFVNQRNREYRAKCKNEMRRGNYDTLPRPVKDAAWLWW